MIANASCNDLALFSQTARVLLFLIRFYYNHCLLRLFFCGLKARVIYDVLKVDGWALIDLKFRCVHRLILNLWMTSVRNFAGFEIRCGYVTFFPFGRGLNYLGCSCDCLFCHSGTNVEHNENSFYSDVEKKTNKSNHVKSIS